MYNKILLFIAIIGLTSLTSCNNHWDSYSTSTKSKKQVRNANSHGGKRKRLNKSSGYSGNHNPKKRMTWKDSYSRKVKKRATRRRNKRDRRREMRWMHRKRKLRTKKRKDTSR